MTLYRSRRQMKRAFREGRGVYENGASSYSTNCLAARLAGRRPMTEAVKVVRDMLGALGWRKITLREIREVLSETHDGEWHHTSKYGNRTNYYDPAAAVAEIIKRSL